MRGNANRRNYHRTAPVVTNRNVPVNISTKISPELFRKLDALCKAENVSRTFKIEQFIELGVAAGVEAK